MNIYNFFYQNKIFSSVFGTLPYCLSSSLSDCETVLDLGCGPSSPIKSVKHLSYSVGVELFEPYLLESKRQGIHNKYICSDIMSLSFDDNSFDAVILIDVLEHLPEEEGFELLRRVERWASKKVVVNSPNGFVKQMALDGNPFQEHLSGWDYSLMKNLGFHSVGLAGLKIFRHEVEGGSMQEGGPMSNIRYHPKIFWFVLAILSQLFTYRVPVRAFSLFSVKVL
jgi:SAM-dependent methyltransferase